MLRLKRLFNRARPEKTELNMLRGMLSTIDKLDTSTQTKPVEKQPATNTDTDTNKTPNTTTKNRDSHD